MTKEELREKRNRTIENLDDIKVVLGLDELYIAELEKENEQIKNSDTLCKLIGEQKIKIAELKAQIEKNEEVCKTASRYL